ncbi:STAS domain-containing protein [Amycolatopsis sp. K13G38]|uniref:STAS domain-containing protein n=2 Tax=Amycolatopsis acididurans TaxID=2724524 RepID=A0ABX1J3R4_9PSEU|nr:STAS domain-containing protein [Amycolatopsis acididurans]
MDDAINHIRALAKSRSPAEILLHRRDGSVHKLDPARHAAAEARKLDATGEGFESAHRLDLRLRRHAGGVAVLSVIGEVDLATLPQLEDALTRALVEKPTQLVVDLSQVAFFGSAGLSALVQAHQQAAQHTRIAVVTALPGPGATSSPAAKPLLATGLERDLDVYATVEDALADCS